MLRCDDCLFLCRGKVQSALPAQRIRWKHVKEGAPVRAAGRLAELSLPPLSEWPPMRPGLGTLSTEASVVRKHRSQSPEVLELGVSV